MDLILELRLPSHSCSLRFDSKPVTYDTNRDNEEVSLFKVSVHFLNLNSFILPGHFLSTSFLMLSIISGHIARNILFVAAMHLNLNHIYFRFNVMRFDSRQSQIR